MWWLLNLWPLWSKSDLQDVKGLSGLPENPTPTDIEDYLAWRKTRPDIRYSTFMPRKRGN